MRCVTSGDTGHGSFYAPWHAGRGRNFCVDGVLAEMVQALLALFAGTVILDALAKPRQASAPPFRSWAGTWLLLLLTGLPFGTFLAITGNPLASTLLALGLVGLLTMVSNAKKAMLGEPLVFTDLALIGAIFRHPQFYFSALSSGQKYGLAMMALAVPALFAWAFEPDPYRHWLGVALLMACLALVRVSLALPPWSKLAAKPDHLADVTRHGLIPTMWLYWIRWRASADPIKPPTIRSIPAVGELAIMVQCESFADPVELFDDRSLELAGLADARAQALQWGNLLVSGFGAYTMRTEYGVLFGRSEEELGFRRYDPFLTAMGESGFAIPERIRPGGWRSLFVHPHDMKFYNRHEIMPAAGFAELVAQDSFAPPGTGEGRYVTDAAIAQMIVELAENADQPTLIYAVTIENHGPWEATAGDEALMTGYLQLVRKGDAMLSRLKAELARMKRPATLVFFGDHRPSIPGFCMPGGVRHTPYVVIRFDCNGQIVTGAAERRDLTPAQLHHTLLDLWSSDRGV